jgi:signal transduction histidine kinase
MDDLFEMAQIDAGGLRLERELSSLSDLISDTLESFSEVAARAGVRLEGSIDPATGRVMMDVRSIGRVLNNLVSNALQYTPRGGAVSISVSPSEGGARIEVADTGDGITADMLPRIFDRFYRGDQSRSRATGGAGLGLAIAKGLVEAHGGQIWVESAPGQGTHFFFTLPEAVAPRPQS